MQLGFIVGIVFAISAVVFAMQNIATVTVSLGFWSFQGSLALVLLVALGIGALIAGLVSSPAMIRRQWQVAQFGRQVCDLERKVTEEKRRVEELRGELEIARKAVLAATPEAIQDVTAVEKPYVGLRALIARPGGESPPEE